MLTQKRSWAIISLGLIASLILAACGAPRPQVVKEEVVVTAVVEKQVVVKEEVPVEVEKEVVKEVEKVVTKEVPVEKVVTPTPAQLGELTIGMNAEYPPFESVDASGKIVGFDVDLIDAIAKAAGFQYELVNTRWDGIFVALASGEFDAVISAATITEERAQTVDFSDPYFDAGQMIAVRADEAEITGADDLGGNKVGVQLGTTGDIWLTEDTEAEVARYDENTLAFQALAAGDVDAAVADGPTVMEIVKANPEMDLKVLPGVYTDEQYGVAVRKDRPEILAAINSGLAVVKALGVYDEIYTKWLGAPPAAAGHIIVGTTDKVTVLDPADSYDFHTWEAHHNTMDTLLHYVPGTTDLEPGLATAMPEVSADGLEYTFTLREGLEFPDGEPFNAEAVKWSIDRVMRLEGDPNWLVTSFVDSVEVMDEYTVKFVLQNPVNYFPLLVATPPYSPVSPECYSADSFDADSTCGGLGPYTITKWDRDVEMVLEAYDGYPDPPATPKVTVKYYADSTTLRLAVESGEVDMATKTLNPTDYADLEAAGELQVVEGPGAQIRYICFNVTTPPFDNAQVRQAIAYAVDRDAVTTIAFQGTHEPLYSMVPMGMWSHIDAFPERDLDEAKALLTAAGYSAANPLQMDLWWTPTHYGPTEADMATVLKDNLEETGMVQVSLQNTEWATYKEYQNAGSMPVFLLGWYPDYLDPDNYTWSWGHSDAADDMGIFYASDEMDALLEAGQTAAELRGDDRRQVYEDAQTLWTEEVPTIPLTQGTLLVVAQPDVTGIVLDPNMLSHYFLLAK